MVITCDPMVKRLCVVLVFVAVVCVSLIAVFVIKNRQLSPQIVMRDSWGARPPTFVVNLTTPVPFVVMHHSYLPAACYDIEECAEAMRSMQDLHQLTNEWSDIGYNFGVGSDGRAYEGRGWEAVGAHSPVYNAMSIGICLIGDWRELLPPKEQLETAKQLIRMGIETGIIQDDYMLVGHRMVRYGTECPGDRLLNEISEWDHFPTAEEIENLYVHYP